MSTFDEMFREMREDAEKLYAEANAKFPGAPHQGAPSLSLRVSALVAHLEEDVIGEERWGYIWKLEDFLAVHRAAELLDQWERKQRGQE